MKKVNAENDHLEAMGNVVSTVTRSAHFPVTLILTLLTARLNNEHLFDM